MTRIGNDGNDVNDGNNGNEINDGNDGNDVNDGNDGNDVGIFLFPINIYLRKLNCLSLSR